jgi:ribonuclease P protein component
MLSSEQRLTSRQFQAVYQRGASYPGRLLVLRVLPKPDGSTRWGFAVGKKIARLSPERSKWRRRLRHVVANMTAGPSDCVITMRQAGLRASVPMLRAEVESLLERATTTGKRS